MVDCVPCSSVSDQLQRMLSGISLATATCVIPGDPQYCIRNVGWLSLSLSKPGDGTFRKQHFLEVHCLLDKKSSFA